MRSHRISFAAGIAALLLVLPTVVSAHGGTELVVGGTPQVDGSIELTGEGFDPNATVRVELQRANAAPIDLGSVQTDEEGDWSATLHVPADAAPGLYQVVATGEDESASAEVTLLAAAGGGPAGEASTPPRVSNDRPAAETFGLLVLAAALAAGGVALLWPDRGSLLRSG